MALPRLSSGLGLSPLVSLSANAISCQCLIHIFASQGKITGNRVIAHLIGAGAAVPLPTPKATPAYLYVSVLAVLGVCFGVGTDIGKSCIIWQWLR